MAVFDGLLWSHPGLPGGIVVPWRRVGVRDSIFLVTLGRVE